MGLQLASELVDKLVLTHYAAVLERWGYNELVLHPMSPLEVAAQTEATCTDNVVRWGRRCIVANGRLLGHVGDIQLNGQAGRVRHKSGP